MMIFLPHKGFSLLELIILLSIVSILCLSFAAFPSIEKHHVHKTTTHLFEVLQWARTEAIKRNQVIAICGTKDFQTCHPDWSCGYIVFVADTKSSHTQILRFEKNNTNVKVNSNQAVIKFGNDGRCFTRATLYFTHDLDKRKIVIYDSGRARMVSLL